MIRWLSLYKKSAILAMACGAVTVLLGILAMLGGWQSMAAVGIVMVINTALHYESYIVTKLTDHRKNTNVLTMAIAETILLTFFALCLARQDWKEFAVIFAVYLVFNGTSLIAIPSGFARCCGIAAVACGALLYYFGREPGMLSWILVGINLIVNGAERIVMSALGGKKKRS